MHSTVEQKVAFSSIALFQAQLYITMLIAVTSAGLRKHIQSLTPSPPPHTWYTAIRQLLILPNFPGSRGKYTKCGPGGLTPGTCLGSHKTSDPKKCSLGLTLSARTSDTRGRRQSHANRCRIHPPRGRQSHF